MRHWFKNNGECQPQRITARAFRRGQMGIGAIGVRRANGPPDRLLALLTLNRAVEALEDFGGVFAFTPGTIMEHHARWCRAVPAPVIPQHRPKIARLGLAPPGVENGRGSFIDVEPGAVGHQMLCHVIHNRRDGSTRAPHPIRQHRSVDRHTMAGHHHGLAIERHIF